MRPLKLKISAFGPYSGVETIDFEKLGTIGENNVSYFNSENILFVNPTIGDYRFLEGAKFFYDIPFEKIGRY
jgi:hypothetical protein